jgi:hypothetical protein
MYLPTNHSKPAAKASTIHLSSVTIYNSVDQDNYMTGYYGKDTVKNLQNGTNMQNQKRPSTADGRF